MLTRKGSVALRVAHTENANGKLRNSTTGRTDAKVAATFISRCPASAQLSARP